MKTFKVHISGGQFVEAQQLATFTRYLQGIQFRFVVTRMAGEQPAVTHRLSGKRVCWITHTEQAACLGRIKDAANLALDHLIQQHSEARLRSVLAGAEAALVLTNDLPTG